MTPRKVVLCLDANEWRRSQQMFVLDIRRFRVVGAESIKQLWRVLATFGPIDVLVAWLPLKHFDAAVLQGMHDKYPEMRTVLLGDHEFDWKSDAFLPSATSTAEMIERIKVLATRKRGPKKSIWRVHNDADSEGKQGKVSEGLGNQ